MVCFPFVVSSHAYFDTAASALTGFTQPPAAKLSGAAWWKANQAKYPNSTRVEDLEPDFRGKVKEFLAALKAAGANVRVSTSRRSGEGPT
jgi:hypothetical protein